MSASAHPSSRELHALHEDERNRDKAVKRLQAYEADLRRLADERWRRRILPLLPIEAPEETDFPGCVA